MISLDKIRKLLQEELNSGVTRRELGKRIGIPPASIYNYLYTETVPELDTIEKIANYFRMSADDLLSATQKDIPDGYRTGSVLSLAGVGRPNLLTEHEPIETIILRNDFLNDHISIVKARGESMQPTIMDGAYCGVDINDKEIVSGRIYLLYFPYEGRVIKRISTGLDGIHIISDNADKMKYPNMTVLPHDIGDHFVLGRVKWVIQKF